MKRSLILMFGVILTVSMMLLICGSGLASEAAQQVSDTDQADNTDSADNMAETAGFGDGKILIAYYSSTGTTQGIAERLAAMTGGDLFVIEPAESYSSEDLNWSDSNSRSSREHDNPDLREMELAANTVESWDEYDTVFIGYPIWWGIAAWPVDAFVKANDFTDKTVVTFCTASSSGIGESSDILEEMAGTGTWIAGERFRSNTSNEELQEWVEGLGVIQ